MAAAPLAIEDRFGLSRKVGGVGCASFAAKILPSDPGEVGLRFPRIDRSRRMSRSSKGIEFVRFVSIDRFGFAIALPYLLSLGLLEAGTTNGEADYS